MNDLERCKHCGIVITEAAIEERNRYLNKLYHDDKIDFHVIHQSMFIKKIALEKILGIDIEKESKKRDLTARNWSIYELFKEGFTQDKIAKMVEPQITKERVRQIIRKMKKQIATKSIMEDTP